MSDPHEAPEDETPGQRRARLMNLNNPGWKPEREDKVEEVPPPETSTIEEDPQPKPPAEAVPEPKRQPSGSQAKDK